MKLLVKYELNRVYRSDHGDVGLPSIRLNQPAVCSSRRLVVSPPQPAGSPAGGAVPATRAEALSVSIRIRIISFARSGSGSLSKPAVNSAATTAMASAQAVRRAASLMSTGGAGVAAGAAAGSAAVAGWAAERRLATACCTC